MSVDYGSYVSRTLEAQDRNFDLVLTKKGAPYSTADHNFQGDMDSLKNRYQLSETPSGIVKFQLAGNPTEIVGTRNSIFPLMNDQPNEMAIEGFLAKVREFIFEVRGTKANGSTTAFNALWNFIQLTAPPATGLRYDLLFLEVWRMQIETGTTVGKPAANKIWPLGNTAWGDATSYFNDDMVDRQIGKEASARIQIQYRFRLVPGVAKIDEPLTDPLVLAQGGNTAPQAGYTYTRDPDDPGLFVAGAGDAVSRTALVTPDGVGYAIPLLLIARRNQQAFAISTNKNGSQYSIALVATQSSDRPDGYYQDEFILDDCVEDLRHAVFLQGVDYQSVLEEEFLLALAGEHQTIGKIDSFGTQDSRLIMQFDGISPIPPGQVGIDDIASPDDFRRIFSDGARDQLSTFSVTEGVQTATGVLRYYPGATFPGPTPPAATPDVVQLLAPTIPGGCLIEPFPFVGQTGEPFAFWRTSGLPVVFLNSGASTVLLTLRRLMLSRDELVYEEFLEEAKGSIPEAVEIGRFLDSSGNGDIVIASETPFNSIAVVLSTDPTRRNTAVSTLTVNYLNGGVWIPVGLPVTDGTASGPVTFAQNGAIDVTGIPSNWVPEFYQNGPKLYYMQLKISSVSFPVNLTSITPQFKTTFWGGLHSNNAWVQLDTTDPAYTAADLIDVTFAVRYSHSNGLFKLPQTFLKAWRNDSIQLHDLAFASENEVFRTAPIQQTGGAPAVQFGLEDYNVLDSSYPQNFGAVRLMQGYVQGNNTPSYVLPGSFAAAVWGTQVTAPQTVQGYYDFEQEVAPGVWNPLTVTPIGGAIWNPGGTFSVTFTGAVASTRTIRYRAIMGVTGFVHNVQEKGIVEIAQVEQLMVVQTGAGSTFDLPASGRILSYETMYNPGTTLNDPVAWVGPAGGPWSREVLVNAVVKNENVLQITHAAPPAPAAEIYVSVVIAYAMPSTNEAWQICYQTPVYQGLESTLVPMDFDLIATTNYATLITTGTGQATGLLQRDDRFANSAYRMPIPAITVVTDGELQVDAIRLPSSHQSRIVEYPRLESAFGVDNGTKLRDLLNINVFDDGTATSNMLRGLSDHSIKVTKTDGSQLADYYLKFMLQKFKFATDIGVESPSKGAMAIWAALARDRTTRE